VEGVFKNSQVGLVVGAQMLGSNSEDKIVGSGDVGEDEWGMGNIVVGGNSLVDQLEGAVSGFLAVIGCRREVKDNQSVGSRVGLRKERLLLGSLLALHLCEFLLRLFSYLSIGWLQDWWWLHGGRWLSV